MENISLFVVDSDTGNCRFLLVPSFLPAASNLCTFPAKLANQVSGHVLDSTVLHMDADELAVVTVVVVVVEEQVRVTLWSVLYSETCIGSASNEELSRKLSLLLSVSYFRDFSDDLILK